MKDAVIVTFGMLGFMTMAYLVGRLADKLTDALLSTSDNTIKEDE
jgi:hypothetical protein